jgi:AcrR family transcriptional regulator
MKRAKLSREDRRKAIVDAAAELFAERGFRGVTTRELAQRVGVTEPVLYEHFAKKSDLYAAIIAERSGDHFEITKEQLRTSARLDLPRKFFLKLAQIIVDKQTQHPEYMRLVLFSALEKHELAQLCFDRHAKAIHEIVIGYIKRQMKSGVIRKTDPALAARAFMGMVLHYAMFELQFGFTIVRSSKKRAVTSMVDIFLRGLSNE